MKKISKAFGYSLAIISMLGFISIIGNTWFEFDFLTTFMSGIILVVLGTGLVIEGQIKKWKEMSRDGLTNNEIAHIVTGTIGVLSVIVGLFDILGYHSLKFDAIKGLIASIAIVVIAMETWLIK